MPVSRKNSIAYILIGMLSLVFIGSIYYFGNDLTPSHKTNNNSIYFPVQKGIDESKPPAVGTIPTPNIQNTSFVSEITHLFGRTLTSNLTKIILQIVLIMLLARLIGVYFRKIGQPTVIGEILAGIIIGPSLLGWVFPDFHSFLYSYDQVEILEILSNLGLILLMFVIGMEIDLSYFKKKQDSTLLISHSGIFIPFIMAGILSFLIYENHSLLGIEFYEFALFLGILMSITAYPLLERILHEKGLSKSSVGNIAMTSSGFVDLVAWIGLGLIIAMVGSKTWMGLSITLFLTMVYTMFMYFLIQPFLQRLSEIYVSRENLTKTAMAIVFVYLFTSSLITEIIGLHALIGAFFAGVIMPSNQKLKSLISERIDYIALVFLLPIFFALTGLRTDITSFKNLDLLPVLGWVLLFSFLGKFFGSSLASRFVGLSWKDSINMGILMNTRGLVALIVINIGFQMGILSVPLFTVFVLMTLVMTLLTSPLLQLVENISNKKNVPVQPLEAFKKILISFAQPSMGVALIKLANFLFGANKDKTQITAIHITPTESLTSDELLDYKKKTFSDIEKLVEDFNLPVEMVHRTTENITYEILNQAKISKSRFLLIGAAKSLFTKNILGGRIRPILSYSPCNIGVLLDNGLDRIQKVLILKKTASGLGYEKMIHYLLREHGSKKIHIHPVAMFSTLRHEDFSGYQLVIIEIELWQEREEFLEVEIQTLDASFLIVQFK